MNVGLVQGQVVIENLNINVELLLLLPKPSKMHADFNTAYTYER